MSGAPWLLVDPWLPVQAPVTNGTDNRSPEALYRVVAQFDVENTLRYQPRERHDGKRDTYCNVAVTDFVAALGLSGPTHWWLGHEQDADALLTWLAGPGVKTYGWRAVSEEQARGEANLGRPVVAGWHQHQAERSEGAHVALLLPTAPEDPFPRCAAAGGHNVFDRPLSHTFGAQYRAHPMMYFAHD